MGHILNSPAISTCVDIVNNLHVQRSNISIKANIRVGGKGMEAEKFWHESELAPGRQQNAHSDHATESGAATRIRSELQRVLLLPGSGTSDQAQAPVVAGPPPLVRRDRPAADASGTASPPVTSVGYRAQGGCGRRLITGPGMIICQPIYLLHGQPGNARAARVLPDGRPGGVPIRAGSARMHACTRLRQRQHQRELRPSPVTRQQAIMMTKTDATGSGRWKFGRRCRDPFRPSVRPSANRVRAMHARSGRNQEMHTVERKARKRNHDQIYGVRGLERFEREVQKKVLLVVWLLGMLWREKRSHNTVHVLIQGAKGPETIWDFLGGFEGRQHGSVTVLWEEGAGVGAAGALRSSQVKVGGGQTKEAEQSKIWRDARACEQNVTTSASGGSGGAGGAAGASFVYVCECECMTKSESGGGDQKKRKNGKSNCQMTRASKAGGRATGEAAALNEKAGVWEPERERWAGLGCAACREGRQCHLAKHGVCTRWVTERKRARERPTGHTPSRHGTNVAKRGA
ncbi:hypothetical protein BKA62DRAFT_783137 [Auriculariales sp. MPI-PUGE-AT-0066]|nr:hypothetical protein BKA62DRAFT_783137 [Auriculariales sp. MPI-PUGE-AT-0066]